MIDSDFDSGFRGRYSRDWTKCRKLIDIEISAQFYQLNQKAMKICIGKKYHINNKDKKRTRDIFFSI